MKLVSLLAMLVASASAMVVECDLDFARSDLKLELQNSFTTVSMPGCVPTWDVGAPSLPVFIALMVIPQGTRVAQVRVTSVAAEILPCSLDVWPVQEPRRVSESLAAGLTEPDPRYYGNCPYPTEVAVVGKRGSMFGYNIASVLVAPVQYTAGSRTLCLHPALHLELDLVPDDYCRQPVVRRSERARSMIESSLVRLVLNPDDVSRFAPNGQ